MEKLNHIKIKNDYIRTEENWLKLHFKTSFGLVMFTFVIECVMGYLLYNIGEIHTTMPRYLVKYLLSPLIINSFLIIIGYWSIYFSRLKHNYKIYMISLFFVGICFVIFSVHSIFTSLFMIFTIPILFTIVYGNYYLTTITALCSIFAKIFSELFVKWDSEKINVMSNNMELVNFIISIVFLLAFYVVSIVIIYFERGKNIVSIKRELERYQLKFKLHNDELTSINNRNALQKAFQNIESDTSGNTYIFVMIDIDNFKKLNDSMGHYKGDLVLSQLGSILKIICNDATPFRFGGDEFCILFKNTKLKLVIEKCQSIQKQFQKIGLKNDMKMPLTVSIGIAKFLNGMTTIQLFENADSALYTSKITKNAINVFDDKKISSQ